MPAAYQPITKEMAATLLSVSKRTIDSWIADHTLPVPTPIGRRVYWHPTVFYAWLDRRLGVEPRASGTPPQECPRKGRPRSKHIQ